MIMPYNIFDKNGQGLSKKALVRTKQLRSNDKGFKI